MSVIRRGRSSHRTTPYNSGDELSEKDLLKLAQKVSKGLKVPKQSLRDVARKKKEGYETVLRKEGYEDVLADDLEEERANSRAFIESTRQANNPKFTKTFIEDLQQPQRHRAQTDSEIADTFVRKKASKRKSEDEGESEEVVAPVRKKVTVNDIVRSSRQYNQIGKQLLLERVPLPRESKKKEKEYGSDASEYTESDIDNLEAEQYALEVSAAEEERQKGQQRIQQLEKKERELLKREHLLHLKEGEVQKGIIQLNEATSQFQNVRSEASKILQEEARAFVSEKERALEKEIEQKHTKRFEEHKKAQSEQFRLDAEHFQRRALESEKKIREEEAKKVKLAEERAASHEADLEKLKRYHESYYNATETEKKRIVEELNKFGAHVTQVDLEKEKKLFDLRARLEREQNTNQEAEKILKNKTEEYENQLKARDLNGKQIYELRQALELSQYKLGQLQVQAVSIIEDRDAVNRTLTARATQEISQRDVALQQASVALQQSRAENQNLVTQGTAIIGDLSNKLSQKNISYDTDAEGGKCFYQKDQGPIK